MAIHVTPDRIYADTEEERLAFYDAMHAGNPVVMAEIEIYRMMQKLKDEEDKI